MENKQQLLERAKKVLLHPNFKKLSPSQIQQAYKTLLNSGLTKDDLTTIIRSSSGTKPKQDLTYLESLPYNVFMNLIMSGEIKGKDLISLCNSSPLINEKCNKAFIGKNGENVPQFIFYALLKKLGINLTGRNDYRNLYVKVMQNLPFLTLQKKIELAFEQLDNLHYSEDVMPKNISDLLYFNLYVDANLGLIISRDMNNSFIAPNQNVERYNRMQLVIHNLKTMRYRMFHEYYGKKEYTYIFDSILTSEQLAKLANMKLKAFLNMVMAYGLNDGPIEDYININEKFRVALNDFWNYKFPGKLNLSDIGRNWSNFVNHTITVIVESADVGDLVDPNLEEENIRNLESIETLTTDELEYLAYLHRKVLSGELPVLTPLTFEELIKY
jgi:hypothetical protein